MTNEKIPSYWAYDLKRKALRGCLRRVLSVKALVLVAATAWIFYCATEPEYRGRRDLDVSRVEDTTFSDECSAALGEGQSRIDILLLSVRPMKSRAGLRAVLEMKACNPTESDTEIPIISVRYVPADTTAPPFTWKIEDTRLGSGFCDEFVMLSQPLGELMHFRGSEGLLQVRGMMARADFELPTCQVVTHILPTPPPTPSQD